MPKESKMKGSPLSKTFVIHLLGVGETFWMAGGHLRWMGRGRMAGMAGQGRPEISVFDCGWSSSCLAFFHCEGSCLKQQSLIVDDPRVSSWRSTIGNWLWLMERTKKVQITSNSGVRNPTCSLRACWQKWWQLFLVKSSWIVGFQSRRPNGLTLHNTAAPSGTRRLLYLSLSINN